MNEFFIPGNYFWVRTTSRQARHASVQWNSSVQAFYFIFLPPLLNSLLSILEEKEAASSKGRGKTSRELMPFAQNELPN